MDPRFRAARRLVPLVAVLAIGVAGVLPTAASAPPSPRPHAVAAADVPSPARAEVGPDLRAGQGRRATRSSPASRSVATVAAAARWDVVPADIPVPAARAKVESTASGGSGAFRGRNHVWIPSLGVSRAVSFYACSRASALDHVVYRWGCGASNNLYLMGHASSVFKPLHDAYRSGRLRKGMEVVYADGKGRVRAYRVSFWKVVRPDGDVAWAYAAQARPSMTLQTCVGAGDSHRLVVRLVAAG